MDRDGPAAPPMVNGELLFEAPWEGRVFGMAQSLASAGLFEWDEFREALIAVIADWEAAHRGEPYRYYERFLEALERVLAARDIVLPAEVAERAAAFAARPHGHDHAHHDNANHDHAHHDHANHDHPHHDHAHHDR